MTSLEHECCCYHISSSQRVKYVHSLISSIPWVVLKMLVLWQLSLLWMMSHKNVFFFFHLMVLTSSVGLSLSPFVQWKPFCCCCFASSEIQLKWYRVQIEHRDDQWLHSLRKRRWSLGCLSAVDGWFFREKLTSNKYLRRAPFSLDCKCAAGCWQVFSDLENAVVETCALGHTYIHLFTPLLIPFGSSWCWREANTQVAWLL